MIQSEAERQFYLGMAGVQLWYARDALPGAGASPDYVFPETEDDPACISSGVPTLPETAPQALTQRWPETGGDRRTSSPKPDLKALMGRGSEAPPGDSVGVSEQEVAPDLTGAEIAGSDGSVANDIALVNVQVQIWMGRRVALVARLSAEVSLNLQATLASNILRSLGEAEPQTLGTVHWPVFNNRLVPGNSLADLGSVLGYVLSDLGSQTLVNLGVDDGVVASAFEAVPAKGNHQQIDFPHSLAEMAATPSLKRELWHQIKPVTVS
jgi:hypothetical protein